MRLELELAVRFVRRRSGALLRGTSLAAFAGVTLATAALVITLALMAGYAEAIAAALQAGNAHLVGFAPRGLRLDQAAALAERLTRIEGVTRATPVTYLSGLIEDPGRPTTPIPITVKAVASPPSFTGLDAWPAGGPIPAVVGIRLAESLGMKTGETATVRLPPQGESWILPVLPVAVAGTFRLAFAEFDSSWIVVPLDRVLAAVPHAAVAGVELAIDRPLAVDDVRRSLEEAEPAVLFTDWREMNRSLFAALDWQTRSLAVVLSLVVAVSSFQVSSALVVLAIDRRRASGMLQALGATPAMVRRVLVWSGLLLGGAGVAGGLALGSVVSWAMTAFRVVRFPPGLAQVYMVDSIPLVLEPLHLAGVVVVCAGLVFGASLWPAWRSSREDPVAALRAV